MLVKTKDFYAVCFHLICARKIELVIKIIFLQPLKISAGV
jgi:hypothetical protein